MSYYPKEGVTLSCDCPGKSFIVTQGDHIQMEGPSNNVYCKLTSGAV